MNFFREGVDLPKKFGIMTVIRFRSPCGLTDRRDLPWITRVVLCLFWKRIALFLPMAQAGPGFAYSAPGRELREVWKNKMTNAVSGASLVSGWLPIFGPETIAELEPVLAKMEQES